MAESVIAEANQQEHFEYGNKDHKDEDIDHRAFADALILIGLSVIGLATLLTGPLKVKAERVLNLRVSSHFAAALVYVLVYAFFGSRTTLQQHIAVVVAVTALFSGREKGEALCELF